MGLAKITPFITPAIIVLGILNGVVFFLARQAIIRLHRLVHPMAHYNFRERRGYSGNELVALSDKAAQLYTIYTNITAVFPLLGIFGTVCSLLGLSGTEDISVHFSTALDTTVWGLIFAIFYKVLDSALSSKLDRALDEADYQIHQLTQEEGDAYAPQEQAQHHH